MALSQQMDAERWRRISELYCGAAAHEEKDRAAFLAEGCAGDEALRREVQSLLDAPSTGEGLLPGSLPAIPQMMNDPSAPAMTGQRLGVYHLQERIGAGGMGEVYRAHDTRLRRDVAVKILPHALTGDPDRRARFEREARVLASVNHPNIATIHGIEDSGAIRALVMELVDTQLTWFERSGESTGTLGGTGSCSQPRISLREDRVAYSRPDPLTGNRDIWTIEVARGIPSPLTHHGANDWYPVWSADGRRMLFGSDRHGGAQLSLYLKTSIDSGAEESPLLDSDSPPYDWSRDGQWIAHSLGRPPASGLFRHPRTVSRFPSSPRQLSRHSFVREVPGSRPNGKWLAYTSNETGRFEVFVRPFAGAPGAGEGKIQISDTGGDFPTWRADGQELFYMSGNFHVLLLRRAIWSSTAPCHDPSGFFARPGSLTRGLPLRGTSWENAFDTVDGKRFLVNCAAQPPGQFVVLMNWSPSEDR